MKKFLFWRSIYAKFALIYLGIWWLLNALTFRAVTYILSRSILKNLLSTIVNKEAFTVFTEAKDFIGVIFIASSILGTVIILLVLRSIVKPINRLSKAVHEVAKGNFEIQLETRSKDEVGQLTLDFNLMTRELKNIEFLRSDFVSNVSHEFKTPVTSIKGFAKLIKDGNLTDEQLREYSDIIISESERLSLLSSNLLRLSELESKVIRDQKSLFSLDEQIRKTILILEVQWSKKEIELDLELESIEFNGNEHLLQEVWLNLIQNAIKFSNQKGTIKITLLREGNTCKVQISDNGIGIQEEDQKRIFERFYKSDKSRSKDGNGLGLVIAKKIVEQENGEIYFTSKLNAGTTFTVELPLIPN